MAHNCPVIFRLLIFILYLNSSLQAFTIPLETPKEVTNELADAPLYKQGKDAMADQLPKVAAAKFQSLLTSKQPWDKATSDHLSLALAEALIHASSLEKKDPAHAQAQQALDILEQDALAKHPYTPLLKAEALSALDRYQEAYQALAAVTSTHPLSNQALITRSQLLIAMARYDEAISALEEAAQSPSQQTKNTALLLTAEVSLIQGKTSATRQALQAIQTTPSPKEKSPASALQAKQKELLQARLALKDPKATDSLPRFQALVTNPAPLTKELYHSCLLGLADAYTKDQAEAKAIATLESFITEHSSSPLIADAFSKLAQLLSPDLPDDHPSMAKLRLWSQSSQQEPTLIYPDRGSAQSPSYQQAHSSQSNDLEALSLYHRASILTQSKSSKNHRLALALLNQLRTKSFAKAQEPTQLYRQLVATSLIDTAYLQLKLKEADSAAFTLSLMSRIPSSAKLRDQANIVQGLLLHDAGKLEDSLSAFYEARNSSTPQVASAANINAGILALKASNLNVFQNIIDTTEEQNIRLTLLLEQALWNISQGAIQGRNDLETFISESPSHARLNEARLKLAEACVDMLPHDTDLAKSQLKILAPLLSGTENQYRITRITIKAEEIAKNWVGAADAAELFIAAHPNDPRTNALILKRGAAYFQNEDYNKARLIFSELANQQDQPVISNYANFYSALSARLGGTAQAREESIELFQRVIDNNGELSSESRIQQSRILIDLRRYVEAKAVLQPLLDAKATPLFRRIDAGILMADCLHREGANDSAKYHQAIEVYQQLILQKDLSAGKRNRLHFLMGKTYESMALADQAFQVYYAVMEAAQATKGLGESQEEWQWFYQCSFQALSILESQSRWQAALKLSRRIAEFPGTRAEEATKRADNIAKTHMIWEENAPLPATGPPEPSKQPATAPLPSNTLNSAKTPK